MPLPVGPGTIQINEDIPGFSTLARADDAAILQFVHDPGGARVSEPEATLHERETGFLFAANDFDALLNEFLVLVAAAVLFGGDGGL